MEILKKIDQYLTTSFKAKDDLRGSTLRMMKDALKNDEIDSGDGCREHKRDRETHEGLDA